MSDRPDPLFLVALHSVSGLGPVPIRLLLDYFQALVKAWSASEAELQELKLPAAVISEFKKTRARALTCATLIKI